LAELENAKVALRREMQAALDVAVAELSKQLGPE
jgi:hypothetical protein